MALGQVRELLSGSKYDAYARRTDGILLALGFVFLVVWTLGTVAVDLPRPVPVLIGTLNVLIWIAFVVDIVIRITLAHSSWRFVLAHPLDILAVLYPPLRPLKILAVFTNGSSLLKGRGAVNATRAVVLSATLLIWIAAVAILGAERGVPGANIASFGDAVWWAIVTTTTVGYGDFYPVTVTGRIVSGALMVLGISLIGVVTATVAAWFVRLTTAESEEREEASIAKNEQEIGRLHDKIDVLEAKIDRLLAPHESKENP
ncbi:potassium channel family protein [Demequina sp.]|uniref:potassium channel family protein n=1 Tax=Demequina sp. TaxID=2050685 RepID=UPI0025BD7117|nr:potassium channel family protein [Demequina sp.]